MFYLVFYGHDVDLSVRFFFLLLGYQCYNITYQTFTEEKGVLLSCEFTSSMSSIEHLFPATPSNIGTVTQ